MLRLSVAYQVDELAVELPALTALLLVNINANMLSSVHFEPITVRSRKPSVSRMAYQDGAADHTAKTYRFPVGRRPTTFFLQSYRPYLECSLGVAECKPLHEEYRRSLTCSWRLVESSSLKKH